ncbi:L,D-transpeptidase family protein [Evansella clarkii]|uniref:L,D-transpeptidase family protein n=1 Tax=Evansella clarkii TaxID=79879 RepID=UPI0015A74FC4|nr:peptidoglycan-binding protein [Evansella clarkii]
MALKKILSCFLVVFLVLSWSLPSVSAASDQLIIINKSNNQLAFYENGKFVRSFQVATGRSQNLTPEGKFKIVNRIVNRPYYKENIPGGDPRNPLGNRWLGINARGTNGNTYAIHGNNNPASIGTYASAGCVRMHNEEVRWLFDKVKVNTPVVITSSSSSFESIAKSNGFKVSGGPSASQSGGTLKQGSRGESVKELQKNLNTLGYNPNGIDGVFGPGTASAVKKFQKDNKLTVDGVAGTKTKNLIEEKLKGKKKPASTTTGQLKTTTLKSGSSGSAVKDLQTKLTGLGYSTKGVDGKYGPNTTAAVKKFQRDNKLTPDGIAGPKTLEKLNNK